MKSVRDSFVKTFGEKQAKALERAAYGHKNGVHDREGSDPFKWVVLITIGYQCVNKFKKSHGITIPFTRFKAWARNHGDLGSHDGDCDYLAMFSGIYNPFLKAKK